LLYALSLAPIYVRNHQLTGEWRYTTISSFNLWYFNIPYYLALKSEDDVYTLRAKQVDLMRQALNREGADIAPIPKEVAMDRLAHRQALGLSEYEYAKWADRLSAPFFKKHFWSYVLHHLNHGLQIFTVSNLSWLKLVFHSFEAHSFGTSPFHWWSVLQQGDLVSWMLFCRLLEVFSVGFYLIAALFALGHFSIKKNMPAWVSLGLSFIVYVPLVCGVNVWGRFRYLFMPMLIAFAVIGIVNGVHAIARRLQRTKLQK
jgi:hypothetical protein